MKTRLKCMALKFGSVGEKTLQAHCIIAIQIEFTYYNFWMINYYELQKCFSGRINMSLTIRVSDTDQILEFKRKVCCKTGWITETTWILHSFNLKMVRYKARVARVANAKEEKPCK